MSSDAIRQINDSFPGLRQTHIRFDVKDKIRAQVVDSERNKVIREIPNEYTSNILMSLYA